MLQLMSSQLRLWQYAKELESGYDQGISSLLLQKTGDQSEDDEDDKDQDDKEQNNKDQGEDDKDENGGDDRKERTRNLGVTADDDDDDCHCEKRDEAKGNRGREEHDNVGE